MPNQIFLSDIANYHNDVEASLKLHFSRTNPDYDSRFATYLSSEVTRELVDRISETNIRSALVVLARLEAAFRIDYNARCKGKMADNISVKFRKLDKAYQKKRGGRVRLDEDIFEIWRQEGNQNLKNLISQLRGFFKFRHWISHGRYWAVGRSHDFQDIYLLADAIISEFPLHS